MRTSKELLGALTTGGLVIAGLAVAAANLHSVFVRPIAVPSQQEPISEFQDWQDVSKSGILVGDSAAPVKIIEFADVSCPFCKRFHEAYNVAKAALGDTIALVFVHMPLNETTSVRGAVAIECADRQSQAEEFIDKVYQYQDSIGVREWPWFASVARIRDLNAFSTCVTQPVEHFRRIADGRAAVSKVDALGTPTVLINQWRFANPPYDALPAAVAEVLHGEKPNVGS